MKPPCCSCRLHFWLLPRRFHILEQCARPNATRRVRWGARGAGAAAAARREREHAGLALICAAVCARAVLADRSILPPHVREYVCAHHSVRLQQGFTQPPKCQHLYAAAPVRSAALDHGHATHTGLPPVGNPHKDVAFIKGRVQFITALDLDAPRKCKRCVRFYCAVSRGLAQLRRQRGWERHGTMAHKPTDTVPRAIPVPASMDTKHQGRVPAL